jgi:hypothetical protein
MDSLSTFFSDIGAVRHRTIEEMDHPTFRPKIHRAPSERRKKNGLGGAVQRLQGEKAGGYVTSPGQVAKHTSALSREEVIEYRQRKKNNLLREEVVEEEEDVMPNQQQQQKFDHDTRSVASSSSSVCARRGGRHATRASPKPVVKHLPNRHRKKSLATNKKKVLGKKVGESKSTKKPTEEERAEAATSTMLRARLLKSRRRTPTKSATKTTPALSAETVREERRGGHEERGISLPNGWSEYVNEQGFVYYGHVDGRSQWNTPAKPARKSGVGSSERERKVLEIEKETSDSPSREELDTMIRGMGQDFLKQWKTPK